MGRWLRQNYVLTGFVVAGALLVLGWWLWSQ